MQTSTSRLDFVDALKALASQLIVLHHLAFYGPMSDAASELAPVLIGWLSDYGRMAVQAFLVVGGFLAARSLAPRRRPVFRDPLGLVWRRYAKLMTPYLAALAVAAGCAVIARAWMQHSSIPAAPTGIQILAHGLLLQDLLGYEALSAGVWYVAIDFQLFALMVAVLWLAQRGSAVFRTLRYSAPWLVAAVAMASLFFFNRNAAWDVSAFYFFGSYAMGSLAYWTSERARSTLWMVLVVAIVAVALAIDFRLRIAVALAVAVALWGARRAGILEAWPGARPVAFLGRISYSVFLVHFPVCLVVNAAFSRFAAGEPIVNLAGMALAWVASIIAGAMFYRLVEDRARGVRFASP